MGMRSQVGEVADASHAARVASGWGEVGWNPTQADEALPTKPDPPCQGLRLGGRQTLGQGDDVALQGGTERQSGHQRYAVAGCGALLEAGISGATW